MTQQYRLASMATWLTSTGISHHSFLPHITLIHLPLVNSSPRPEIAPQSLSSQLLHLPGDLRPCPGYIWLLQGLSDSHSFRLPQISCFTLSLKCFSSDSDSCPDVRMRPLLLFSHLLRVGPVLLTPLFFPSSFVLLSFAWFYTFFSSAQVLLSTLSWGSACTSVSEGVFLMYPCREMYSVSTYSFAILFFSATFKLDFFLFI